MSFGVADVTIVGNVGSEPDTRFTPNGTQVTNFSVAVNNNRRTAEDPDPEPEWFRVAIFGKQAELADQFVRKGSRIFVTGRLNTSTWTDRDGGRRTSLEVVGNTFIVFDRNDQGNAQYASAAPQRAQPKPVEDDPLNDLPF